MTAIYDFFIQNWEAESKLETSFLTDISSSVVKLSEHRLALYDRPKRLLSVRWTGINQDETNRLLMGLMRGGMQQLLVPFYMDQAITTGTSSGTTINCPTANRHFVIGERVVIFSITPDGRPKLPQVLTIAGMTSGTITTGAITGSYLAGSRVFPLMLAEFVMSADLQLLTDQKSDLSLTFSEVFLTAVPPTSSVGALGSQTSSANSVGGELPILDAGPDFTSKLSINVSRAGEKYALGRDSGFDVSGDRPNLEFSFTLRFSAKADSWAFLEFFESRRGRALPWWLVNPATLYDATACAAGYVDVTPSGDLTNIQDFLQYLAVVLLDGTIYIRKVSSVALVSGKWRISATGLPGLSIGSIQRVTSAHYVRFSKDAMTLSHVTDEVSAVDVLAVEIQNETISDAALTSPLSCGDGGIDCVGVWTICLVAYLDDPRSIGGDCPPCLIGFGTHVVTINPGDPCTVTVAVPLAIGYLDTDDDLIEFAGGCAGSGDSAPIVVSNTFSDFVLVYAGDHGGLGRPIHVYANMFPGADGSCATLGFPRHLDDTRSGCADITPKPDWY